jgi:hypothetical protein
MSSLGGKDEANDLAGKVFSFQEKFLALFAGISQKEASMQKLCPLLASLGSESGVCI